MQVQQDLQHPALPAPADGNQLSGDARAAAARTAGPAQAKRRCVTLWIARCSMEACPECEGVSLYYVTCTVVWCSLQRVCLLSPVGPLPPLRAAELGSLPGEQCDWRTCVVR